MWRSAGYLLLVLLLAATYGLGVYTGPRAKRLFRPAPDGGDGSLPAVAQPRGALGRLQPADGVISVYGVTGDRVDEVYDAAQPGKTIRARKEGAKEPFPTSMKVKDSGLEPMDCVEFYYE